MATRSPKTPHGEALALAVRMLAAVLPEEQIEIGIHRARPEALALLRSMGATTTTSRDGTLNFVRVNVGAVRITGYEDVRPETEPAEQGVRHEA